VGAVSLRNSRLLLAAKALSLDSLTLLRDRQTPLLYSGSAVVSSIAQLVAGVLLVKWVIPEDLGLWQSVRLAQTYAFILLFGMNNGLSRELPYFLGRNDRSFADKLAGTTLLFTNLASVIVLVGGLGCALIFGGHQSKLIFAIGAVTLLIPLSFYQNILIVAYRSRDSFKKLTLIQFVGAGLGLATLPLIYYCGYRGMLIRLVVISAIVVAWMYMNRPIRAAPALDRNALKILLKTGLPIFGLDYLLGAAGTSDRIVLLHIGGVEAVGYYALAQVAYQMLTVIPGSLAQYVYPRMTFDFGQHGDKRNLWRMGFRFFVFATVLMMLAAICGRIALPYVVPVLAPKYLAGLRAAEIMLIAGIFEGAGIMPNALWSMKAWKMMVIYQISASTLLALGPILGTVVIGQTLEGVAWGVVAGSCGRCVLALGITYLATREGRSARLCKS
jgi:O-antigen/teichoic acid export membrane protein